MHGAAHEEFVCEVVDELADWDYLKVSVGLSYVIGPVVHLYTYCAITITLEHKSYIY